MAVSRIIRDISPNDLMFHGAERAYWGAGQSAMECIDVAMREGGVDSVERILDLPCGHGRVLRWLRAEWPDAEIVACDLDRDGVDFCADTFRATAVYSHQHPPFIDARGKFDLIWCGSLLTHLNKPRWYPFLEFFASRLSGVLVFTTGGTFVAQAMREGENHNLLDWQTSELLRDFDESGFGYWDYPLTPNYGLARAKPSWVNGLLERLPLQVAWFEEAGWCKRQDVFACIPE